MCAPDWLRPELVAQIDFLEWTGADRLRHSKFNGVSYRHPVNLYGESYLANLTGTLSKGPSAGPFNSFPSGVNREP
jgi:hypothetical protein